MTKNHKQRAAVALACAMGALLPTHTLAQGSSDRWVFDVAIYGWFPAISGSTAFPSGASGPSFDVSAGTVIDSLKMAAMGAVQATKGERGVWSDIFYGDLGGSKQGTRDISIGGQPLPGGVDGKVSLDVNTIIWSFAGTYTLTSTAENRTDVLFGTRMVDVSQTLDWSLNGNLGDPPLVSRSGTARLDITNWDAIVGLKGHAFLDNERKWFVPYYLDVGTGQSKLT